MKLTHSQMRYVLAIHRLSENAKSVRSADIAKFLGFSRPSVSRMLRVLSELGVLEENNIATISFSEAGRAFAKELRQTSEGLSCRLRETLGLSFEAADDCALLLMTELQEPVGRIGQKDGY